VVALQIRGVSEPTRSVLSAEARARGESLQEYLLDLLDREAHDIEKPPPPCRVGSRFLGG
jgi:antitoxin FitA